MANKMNFKGFRQVSLAEFELMPSASKLGYMWLVRKKEGDDVKHSQIYFGTRLYAEINSDSQEIEKLENLIKAMGDMVDENGEWVGFLPSNIILGDSSISSTTLALEALETAILTEVDDRKDAISALTNALQEEIDARIEADVQLVEALSAETIAREEADAELLEKIENLEKLGPLYFAGVASAVTEDGLAIITFEGEEIYATSANTGAVYLIEKKEYASDGSKWIELGDESELAELIEALKEEVEARQEAEAELHDEIDALNLKIEELETELEAEDRVHLILGNDVETLEEAGVTAEEVAESELKSVVETGGALKLSADVENNTLIQL